MEELRNELITFIVNHPDSDFLSDKTKKLIQITNKENL